MITDDNPFDDMPEDDGAFGSNPFSTAPPPRPPKQDDMYAPPPRPAPSRPPKPATTTTTTTTTTSSATALDIADYERRLADLEARERAVEERERKVAQDQAQADMKLKAANNAAAGQPNKPEPNWPPCFPKKIVYQNFSEEIPDCVRMRVRFCYWHFLGTLVLLIYNVVCAISCMVAVSASAIGDLILACVYIPFLGALHFFVFRRLYKAAKAGNSLSYFLFFIGFTIEIIIAIVALVGPKQGGFMGILWTIEAFGEEGDKNVGFMCLVDSILWGVSAGFMIYLWIHVRVNFTQAGGIEAMRKQALEKATLGVVKAAKEHPDAAKKVGKAAVDYAKENPDVIKDAAGAAYGVAQDD